MPIAIAIPVSLLYGGLNALLVVALGLNVTRLRWASSTRAGQPLPKQLALPVRAHGNAAEWIPLGLVLLLALELSRAGTSFALHLLGGGFLLARALHAAGLYGKFKFTIAGAALNYLVLTAMGAWALAARLGS